MGPFVVTNESTCDHTCPWSLRPVTKERQPFYNDDLQGIHYPFTIGTQLIAISDGTNHLWWLDVMIRNIFAPRGILCNGSICWDDGLNPKGMAFVIDNTILTYDGICEESYIFEFLERHKNQILESDKKRISIRVPIKLKRAQTTLIDPVKKTKKGKSG